MYRGYYDRGNKEIFEELEKKIKINRLTTDSASENAAANDIFKELSNLNIAAKEAINLVTFFNQSKNLATKIDENIIPDNQDFPEKLLTCIFDNNWWNFLHGFVNVIMILKRFDDQELAIRENTRFSTDSCTYARQQQVPSVDEWRNMLQHPVIDSQVSKIGAENIFVENLEPPNYLEDFIIGSYINYNKTLKF
ncbi:hypothetical protein C1646_750422 [Rhizophagus diaphanus]|nr:hypothetical protein C1646_750422 [Rhizophagus diaphanus] [Rhizophagus sp. MUCL 43196]